MLVLSRKKNEGVTHYISPAKLRELADKGEPLLLHSVVVEIRRDVIRIGYDAPKGVDIYRDELTKDRPWSKQAPWKPTSTHDINKAKANTLETESKVPEPTEDLSDYIQRKKATG